MSMLDLVGDVPWVWLAGCRDCGEPHQYVPDPVRLGYMTWATSTCPTYRPRLERGRLDALMLAHKSELTTARGPAGR